MADSIYVRSGIGLCLIGAISGLCFLDYWSGHGYGAIVLGVVLVMAGLREYGKMVVASTPVPTAGLMVAGALFMACKGLQYELDPRLGMLQAPVAVAFAYWVFFGCLRGAPSQERFRSLATTAFGFFYIPILGGFAIDARFSGAAGPAAFYYIIAIAKGTDIFAYFFGKLTGKTKVVPSVSPGKTVAGFVGALVGGVSITALFSATTELGRHVPLSLAVGVGIVMALIVVSGDLIESFIKRSVEVKDSANMLPQFGGVLDIIDSVLIAAPPVYFLLLASSALQGVAP